MKSGPLQRDLAIILGTRDFQENDALVTFYTQEHGRLTGVARSAKKSHKRFGGGLERGAEVIVHFVMKPSSQLVSLREIEVINGHLGLRNHIGSLAAATYIGELVTLATQEGEGSESLFALLSQLLTLLETEPQVSLVRLFELKLLQHLGYQPLLDRCVTCQTDLLGSQEPIFGFSLKEGGIFCPLCERKNPVMHHLTRSSLLFLRETQELPLEQMRAFTPTRETLINLDAVLPPFVSYRLEKPLRSLAFLRSTLHSSD